MHGFANLERHAQNLRKFGVPVVVAINRFATDTEAEIATLRDLCEQDHLPVALADVWGKGGAGTEDLAHLVTDTLTSASADYSPLYPDSASLKGKIEAVGIGIYRAARVEFSPAARTRLAYLTKRGYGKLPVCIAKTQYSFSDDATQRGTPTGHTLTIRDVKLSAGAGFVVAYAGTLLTMPGLPRHPAAEEMAVDENGRISGLS
jgi:formate--tetrahydrofolate ligase